MNDKDDDADEWSCAEVTVAEAICSARVQRVRYLRLGAGFDFFDLPCCTLTVLRARAKKNLQPAADT